MKKLRLFLSFVSLFSAILFVSGGAEAAEGVTDYSKEKMKSLSAGGYHFLTILASSGKGIGQYNSPFGIAVDVSGNVYVADTGNHRIQKFSSTGAFISALGPYGDYVRNPTGVAVDASGNVYVINGYYHWIEKFTSTGAFITLWDNFGLVSKLAIGGPFGIAVDALGNVYVADGSNHRIQKFTSAGDFVTAWGSEGTGNGQFSYPNGVAVDASGNVYVGDRENHRIEKFTSTGDFVTAWGSFGTGQGQFNEPFGVAVDASGNVYVADDNNHRIQKFTSTGAFITAWGSEGPGNGQFYRPMAVAVDISGNVYVVDLSNRIQKFGPTRSRVEGLVMKEPVSKKTIASSAPSAAVAEKKESSVAKKYTASAAQKSTSAIPTQPAIPNVSGLWKSSNGLVYDIKQTGDRFEWTVKDKNENAEGVIKENKVFASWKREMRSGTLEGKITTVDPTGKATQIDWNSGMRFFR